MPRFPGTFELFSPQHLLPQGRILLVDREARDREHYAQLLRKRGFFIHVCPSYEEGQQCLEHENFDLVIVDQGGPAFEGRVIASRSVLKDRRVPVLVMTRHHDISSYLEAIQLGAADYLEKPIAGNDFIWWIETHLPSSSVVAKPAN